MAVPADMTLRTLNGKFAVNKTHSDSLDKIMALQGFSYLIRVAARTATMELTFTSTPISSSSSPSPSPSQSPNMPQPSKIKIATSISAAGMSFGKEKVDERTIDGVEWEENDGALGSMVGRAWWCELRDVGSDFEGMEKEVEFLRGFDGKDRGEVGGKIDWGESKWRLKAGDGAVVDGGDEVIRLQVQAEKSGAVADHVWAFEEGFGDGEEMGKRRYTRRILARKGDKVEMARMVYDYLGPS